MFLEIGPEHAYPVRQSIAGNVAEGKKLMDARAERSTTEVEVEIVWKKIRRRTAVQLLRPLRYLVQSEALESKDRLDLLCKVRSEFRHLPAACWHVPWLPPFARISGLRRPLNDRANATKVGAWSCTCPQGAFWHICSQRFNFYRQDESQFPQLFVACPVP